MSKFFKTLITMSKSNEAVQGAIVATQQKQREADAEYAQYEALSKAGKWREANEHLEKSKQASTDAWTQSLATFAAIEEMLGDE